MIAIDASPEDVPLYPYDDLNELLGRAHDVALGAELRELAHFIAMARLELALEIGARRPHALQ